MKKLLLLILLIFVVACTLEQETVDIQKQPVNEQKQIPVAIDQDGTTVYLNSKSTKDKFEKLYPEFTYITLDSMETYAKGRGNGKKKIVKLNVPESATFNRVSTNVMLDPVEIPDTYNVPLPAPIGTSALVDWDGDGVEDLFEINQRCYFPRTFTEVTVNGVIINNSIAFGAEILGFDDVNGDGTLDVLLEGGNHYRFNSETFGTSDETYSQYNVGYNIIAETPDSLDAILSSLIVESSVNNPDFLRWDMGRYFTDVSEYNGMIFHVLWQEVDPVTLEPIDGISYQTHTYPEWGIYSAGLPVSGTLKVGFSNANNPCQTTWIYVTY